MSDKVVTRHEQTRSRCPRMAPRGSLTSLATAAALEVGERVRFRGEGSARFKVRAKGGRYVILTYPFHQKEKWRGNHIYTVIDLYHGIRGTDDCVGSLGYETDEQIAHALERLESDEFQISVRNNVTLEIAEVKEAKA
jgi:hypothetical protein